MFICLLFLRRLASNYHQKIDNHKIISDNFSFCKVCSLTFSVNEIVQEDLSFVYTPQ